MVKNVKYEMSIDPIGEYLKHVSYVLGKKYNLTKAEIKGYLIQYLKENKIKIPDIFFNDRDRFGDFIENKDSLPNYLKFVKQNKKILAPSFTVYENPKTNASLHPTFITVNVNKRSEEKKISFKAELEGDMDTFIKYDILQGKRKINNNSLSGTYGTNGTPLSNTSAHFTLTSITRCVSGIGNGLSEIFVGGNRYFKTPAEIVNYIASVSANLDENLVRLAIAKYDLKILSSKEVIDILYGNLERYLDFYPIKDYCLELLDLLDPYIRTGIIYVNDLWNIKNFNPKFVYNFITKLGSKAKDINSIDPLTDLKEKYPGISILTKLIFSEEIKGKLVKYDEMLNDPDSKELVYKMASTTNLLNKAIEEYETFFRAFFYTNILPPNVAYISNMVRDNIVLSDTDSTCCSYDRWVEWYNQFGKNDNITDMGICSAVMTINSNLINHGLRVISTNMGVSLENSKYLEMKNEFYWDSFVVSNQTKHYYASTLVREGNVYAKPKLEKKGVHFIASNSGQLIVDKINELMLLILDKSSKKEQLPLLHLITEVKNIEKQLMDNFFNKDFSLFRRDSIKEAKAYKAGDAESKYQYHIFWNEVFGDIYGKVEEPPYYIYNIPLTLGSKTSFGEFLQDLQTNNPTRYEKYLKYFGTKNRDNFGVLRLPLEIANKNGIPTELFPYVDYKRSIKQTCLPLYVLLETVGYKKPEEFLLLDII